MEKFNYNPRCKVNEQVDVRFYKNPSNSSKTDIVWEFPDIPTMINIIEQDKLKKEHADPTSPDTWAHGDDLRTYTNTMHALNELEMPPQYLTLISEFRETLIAKDNIQALFKKAHTIKRKRIFQDEWAELDIDRLLSWDENHWSSMSRRGVRPTITIHCNNAKNAGSKEKDFFQTWALLAVVCEILNQAWVAVEVIGFDYCDRQSMDDSIGNTGWMYTIKKPEDPMNLHRIASSGLPGLFRSVLFTYFNAYVPRLTSWYGRPAAPSTEQQRTLWIDHYFWSIDIQNDWAVTDYIESLLTKTN